MNLVDSSGWLEFFTDGPRSSIFAPIILDSKNLIISVINKYEVFKILSLRTDEQSALNTIGAMYSGRVIEISDFIAMSAAELSLKYQLPMADSMLLATAQAEEAILWTKDAHFENIPGVKYIV